jgi:hypothetical protein
MFWNSIPPEESPILQKGPFDLFRYSRNRSRLGATRQMWRENETKLLPQDWNLCAPVELQRATGFPLPALARYLLIVKLQNGFKSVKLWHFLSFGLIAAVGQSLTPRLRLRK